MTHNPESVHVEGTLSEAARLIYETGIRAVIVRSNGELIGILSDRDIIRAAAEGRNPSTPIKDLVSGGDATVNASDTLHMALEAMRRHAVNYLPVVEQGRVIGMVSLGDLFVEQEAD